MQLNILQMPQHPQQKQLLFLFFLACCLIKLKLNVIELESPGELIVIATQTAFFTEKALVIISS